MTRFRLKLKRLDFISAVDMPAQETATALLLKSDGAVTATARVVKTSDLGLVFGWALTAKSDGADYYDRQGDNVVEDDLIRVAAEFMEQGGATDTQHDFERDGRVVFAMPMTAEVAQAFGIETDTTGLMIAIKPSPDVFAKFKAGELTGFSIAGVGDRVPVDDAPAESPGTTKSTRTASAPHRETIMADKPTVFVLTEAQHAHYAKLAPADAEAFLGLTAADRDADIAKALAADPVEFAGEHSGITLRKSEATPFAMKLAKAAEDSAALVAKQRAEIAKQEAEIAKAEEARKVEILKSRAKSELGRLAGSDEVKISVLKAIDGIEGALEMLRGADAAAATAETAPGVAAVEPTETDPAIALDALVAAEMSKGVDRARAVMTVTNTTKGADLYAAVQKRIKARK